MRPKCSKCGQLICVPDGALNEIIRCPYCDSLLFTRGKSASFTHEMPHVQKSDAEFSRARAANVKDHSSTAIIAIALLASFSGMLTSALIYQTWKLAKVEQRSGSHATSRLPSHNQPDDEEDKSDIARESEFLQPPPDLADQKTSVDRMDEKLSEAESTRDSEDSRLTELERELALVKEELVEAESTRDDEASRRAELERELAQIKKEIINTQKQIRDREVREIASSNDTSTATGIALGPWWERTRGPIAPPGTVPSTIAPSKEEHEAIIQRFTILGQVHRSAGGSVEMISLQNSDASDTDLVWLKQFPNVHSLNLAGTAITDRGVQYLNAHANLLFLDLSDTAVSDQSLTQLKTLPRLTVLTIKNTRMTDEGLRKFSEEYYFRHWRRVRIKR